MSTFLIISALSPNAEDGQGPRLLIRLSFFANYCIKQMKKKVAWDDDGFQQIDVLDVEMKI